jgi:hypothetical protein
VIDEILRQTRGEELDASKEDFGEEKVMTA